ncbi:iron-sulfur cluster assembly accessory protein [Candidatus Endowatersipora endosymbiont of Watersipora subatra]|uniref:iron-sulfur cluster assembly accessory protein n=1 Tax=Candidatus Endowatersipora endosymbiont of Watersipora subatra TaxID=3077946 RepID=UPI00312CBCA6
MASDVITLTDSAVTRISEIVSCSKEACGIRVGIKNGGCAGMEYTVDLVTHINPKDERVEKRGITVFIAPEAFLFLLGSEIDYQITRFRSSFVFNNPNQTSICGCGESVTLIHALIEKR